MTTQSDMYRAAAELICSVIDHLSAKRGDGNIDMQDVHKLAAESLAMAWRNTHAMVAAEDEAERVHSAAAKLGADIQISIVETELERPSKLN